MWHNTYFLIPAVLLVAAAFHADRTTRRAKRVANPRGLPGRGLSLLSAAFLSGGPGRVFDTALVRMHVAERAVISRSGLVTLTHDRPHDAVDQAIMDAVGPTRSRGVAALRADVMRSPAVQALGDDLADRGLMRHPDRLRTALRARRLLRLSLLPVPVATVLAFLLDDGHADRPALWAPVVLLVFGLAALIATRPPKDRITPAGRRQLVLMDTGKPWTPNSGLYPRMTGGAVLGAIALGGLAAAGTELGIEELQELLLGAAAQQAAMNGAVGGASSYSSGASSSSGSGSSCSGSAVWCGSSDSGSTGSGSSGCGSSSSGCGSSHSSCGGSSSSCGSSGSSCGSSSSSCGSSCGGGCGS
ncbi:TIGR04222 domain-containing membrane protein [Streptomyces sp. FH025]|uniref:TIGR04222 domain-containing membrane protein n=1 Tax=Streptomyces sp. FH025 TaxID=2815937 RepID=UPI001A9E06DF|nr:TIGR04222 domain-containing membrane protein [Streptomyces sp. FH025]MBO1415686.1 TIGR04222 domain-containing membrane protein [Streptomyces sp. FH025]